MVHEMHDFLQQGYFTAAMRHGDFYYSYFLYFEDVAVSISSYSVCSGKYKVTLLDGFCRYFPNCIKINGIVQFIFGRQE